MNGIPLEEWSGSGAIKDLQKTIENFNIEASKSTGIMVKLTWAIVFLTLLLLIGLVIQVYIALDPQLTFIKKYL